MLDAHTDLYEAHGIYKEAAYQNFRFEIEARVMANEPVAGIGRKLGVSPAIISAFEACFFDVRSRLDAQSYIKQCVLQPAAIAGLKSREYDLLWKMYGYWGGPAVLDALIYGMNSPSKPDSPASVAAFWQDDIADQVRLKAALAMRKMQVDSQTQQEIVNAYQKMLELERTAGEGKGTNEAMLTNINAMLGELPWRKYQRTEAALTEADKFDAADVNLRSMQLIAAGSGGVPADLHAVLMSAKFPAEPDAGVGQDPAPYLLPAKKIAGHGVRRAECLGILNAARLASVLGEGFLGSLRAVSLGRVVFLLANERHEPAEPLDRLGHSSDTSTNVLGSKPMVWRGPLS